MKETLKKFNWKAFAIATAVIYFIFQAFTWYVKSEKEFRITYHSEVTQTPTQNGGYVAGAPATYTVEISPALAWEKSRENNKVWHNISLVLILFAAVFITLMAMEKFEMDPKGADAILFVLLGFAIACWFAAHSSMFTSNSVNLSPQIYEVYKDSLPALFDKTLIR